jgi:hypothetical protein
MKKIFQSMYLFLAGLLFTGCAGVKIYSDKELKNETGLKYYHSKPFLLVERNPAKDVALKSTIIYLPDMANPYYAKMIRGMGSNDLKLAFESGSISSYGVVTDSKVPETISSLASLVTGYGGAVKAIAEGKKALVGEEAAEPEQGASVADLKKVDSILKPVIADVKALANRPYFKSDIATTQKQSRAMAEKELDSVEVLISKRDPELTDRIVTKIKASQKALEAIKTGDTVSPNAAAYNDFVSRIIKELVVALEVLQPPAKQESVIELYEIQAVGNSYSLKRVNFQ